MLQVLSPVIAALAGIGLGGKGGGTSSSGGGAGDASSLTPELRDILALHRDQTLRQDPLHQAITSLALQMLPMFARKGLVMRTPGRSFPGSGGAGGRPAPTDLGEVNPPWPEPGPPGPRTNREDRRPGGRSPFPL